jgi:Nudix N-terminal
MAESVFCSNCGDPIKGEAPSGDPAQRKPCPRCGSMGRRFDVQVSVRVGVGVSATAIVIPYPEALLTKAQELIVNGDFSIAVVVAHMACEISVERAISQAFATKDIGYLEVSVLAFLSGYNLANERIRDLYNAITGDQIQNQSFWGPFKASAKRRNDAVHGGKTITKADAEASYQTTSDLIAYLK